MPTFFPRIPATFAISLSPPSLARHASNGGYWLGLVRPSWAGDRRRSDQRLLVFLAERLDLHIHARGEIEFHQRIYRLLRGLENIEQTLVGTDLKLLPRLLVDVRGAQHAILVLHRGQRNRARDLRPGAARGIDNLTRRLVEDAIVVSFQPYANSFFSNHVFTLLPLPAGPGGKIWRQAARRIFPGPLSFARYRGTGTRATE